MSDRRPLQIGKPSAASGSGESNHPTPGEDTSVTPLPPVPIRLPPVPIRLAQLHVSPSGGPPHYYVSPTELVNRHGLKTCFRHRLWEICPCKYNTTGIPDPVYEISAEEHAAITAYCGKGIFQKPLTLDNFLVNSYLYIKGQTPWVKTKEEMERHLRYMQRLDEAWPEEKTLSAVHKTKANTKETTSSSCSTSGNPRRERSEDDTQADAATGSEKETSAGKKTTSEEENPGPDTQGPLENRGPDTQGPLENPGPATQGPLEDREPDTQRPLENPGPDTQGRLVNLINLLIARNQNLNETFKNGETLLILAIYENNLEAVRLLIYNGANVHVRNRYDQTALMLATRTGKADIVEALLQAGADPNQYSV